MREFLDIKVLFWGEDFSSEFCKDCSTVKEIYPKTPEEPVKWNFTACGWDFSDLHCLRRDALEEIIEAID